MQINLWGGREPSATERREMWGYGGPHDVDDPYTWIVAPIMITVVAVWIAAFVVTDHTKSWVTIWLVLVATLMGVGVLSTLMTILWRRSRAPRQSEG